MTERWPAQRAREWYERQGWIAGCNFIPSTAVNQLEMWMEETWDRETISRELAFAEGLGFNTVRVYLHDMLWVHDRNGFFSRINEFLAMADSLGIKTLFVIFDDCWNPRPRWGTQPDPVAGIHNSGWVNSPGFEVLYDKDKWGYLEEYVKDLLREFGKDHRILMWDLYNEVGNYFLPGLSRPQPAKALFLGKVLLKRLLLPNRSLGLLRETFRWAREAGPSQPLTSCIWFPDRALNKYVTDESDIITFHNYKDVNSLKKQIQKLKEYGRPLICTEYMARTMDSFFETHMPVFKEEHAGCINWGLVAGKSQTHFSWQDHEGSGEPDLWFHDILRKDGAPYREDEVLFIKKILGKE